MISQRALTSPMCGRSIDVLREQWQPRMRLFVIEWRVIMRSSDYLVDEDGYRSDSEYCRYNLSAARQHD